MRASRCLLNAGSIQSGDCAGALAESSAEHPQSIKESKSFRDRMLRIVQKGRGPHVRIEEKVIPMSKTSTLELPIELKERIERVAKERKEEPATLLAFAIDSLLTAHEAQLAEIRRRDLVSSSNSGKSYTHEKAMAKLDSLRPSRRTSESKCCLLYTSPSPRD